MIEKKKRRTPHYFKEKIMAEIGENPTAKDVLDHLIGDQYGRASKYTVYEYESSDRTLANRLNMIWVFPLFLLSIPFQWVFLGSVGVSRDTKVGRIVDKLVKFE